MLLSWPIRDVINGLAKLLHTDYVVIESGEVTGGVLPSTHRGGEEPVRGTVPVNSPGTPEVETPLTSAPVEGWFLSILEINDVPLLKTAIRHLY